MRRTFLFVVAILLSFASSALAQSGPCPTSTATAVNPTWVCITPASAAEHTANDPVTGLPIVVRYDLLFFAPGVDTSTGSPVQTVNIGKPTLNAQGVMWLQRSELGAIPVGQLYKARVIAIGQGTLVSARSPESNPFGRSSQQSPSAPTLVSIVGQ